MTPRFALTTAGVHDPLWLASLLDILHRVGGMRPRMVVWDGGGNVPVANVRVLYDELHARYFLPMIFRQLITAPSQ